MCKIVTRFNGYALLYDTDKKHYWLGISIYPHSAARFKSVKQAFRYFARVVTNNKIPSKRKG